MTFPSARRRWLRALAAGALAGQGGGLLRAEGKPLLRVAVVPQFPAADIHRDWAPLLERLGAMVGVGFQLQIQPNIPRFETEVLAGTPDLVYLNPYHQVMAHRAQGYLPLVHGRVPLTGILVVRKDSPLRSVQGLAGQTLAFPAPNAFGASLWMRALLTEREKLAFNPSYVQTHSNVYRQVIQGAVAAGGGVNHTLGQERDEVRSELRVLLETPGVAPHPVSAHPRVDAGLRQAIADAFLTLAGTPAGLAMLKAVEMDGAVRADHGRDYQPLEAYRLDRYVVMSRPA